MRTVGLHGKLPAHGDFVSRGLPWPLVRAWDRWISQGLLDAEERQGAVLWDGWESRAPRIVWLPGGLLDLRPVVGVVLPSRDAVGRRFPLALLAVGVTGLPEAGWCDTTAAAGARAIAERVTADGLLGWLRAPAGGDLPPSEPLVWCEGAVPATLKTAASLFAPVPSHAGGLLA